MRVLQLIDSLHAGGAERVAVNYANALVHLTESSYLCATRAEGILKESLSKEVHYLFLKKTATIDLKAIKTLNGFIKNNEITIIHAHSSSFFLATLLKVLHPKLVLVWHEHYGNRNQTSNISKFILKSCSYFFTCIITVNESLKLRCEKKLLTKNVYVLPNYPIINSLLKVTTLYGESGKRVVCLANFRPDKDHINLLKAFKLVITKHSDWTLHLVGQDLNDDYSKTIKSYIKDQDLEAHVFLYGSCSDINHILYQSSIGVLSSKSEGLPLALLEYGLAGLPVVATNVGDCFQVISNTKEGLLIPSENKDALSDALCSFITNTALRHQVGQNLKSKVTTSFSETAIINRLLKLYKQHSL
ncbi:glycosyltransferase [Yeosuana marina]|uniref:glycosyltransferase n=1 Tax=Yeosuana marina TaxID=1565536 RepID=UPI00141F0590|nr:glycosyltransferase [Yeosuana marina]